MRAVNVGTSEVLRSAFGVVDTEEGAVVVDDDTAGGDTAEHSGDHRAPKTNESNVALVDARLRVRSQRWLAARQFRICVAVKTENGKKGDTACGKCKKA